MESRTLLVVDDEPDMEMLIRQKFRKQIASGETRFLFAQNGQQAIEIIEKEPDVELVLTDINMPVLNGLQLLEQIADRAFTCKCIVVSAYTDIQNIRIAMNSGAFDFITKPIDFTDLETTVRKTLKAYDESKNAREALRERDQAIIDREHALTSERFKQQFLANMSHEIRTPMNSVIGIANLLLRSELDAQQHKYVKMIQSASEQLMSIINDILDISKIEAGKMVFENIPFSLVNVVENVRNMMVLKAEERNLDFIITTGPELPRFVTGDPSRLTQILLNLVSNAIKFTDHGKIEIQVVLDGELQGNPAYTFSVTDTGIGISPEHQQTIFESFTQADSDTSRKYGGTGLGLTITKQLVELQGGTIGLESTLGEGTRFYFTLGFATAAPQAEPVEETVSTDPAATLHGVHVLLVEDNDFNRVVAQDTLNEHIRDLKMDFAFNGRMAVDMVTEQDYDLVLMDIQMPEMDGYEATRTIRHMPTVKHSIPIMAMTANATPEEINKCFESGVDAYISKPFVTEDLLQKMAHLLLKKR